MLRLDRMPERDTLCPNDQLFLRCNHNNTFNDPEWRVINGTQVIHRGITFRGSTLKGTHLLVENTKVLEVLAIDKVQHDLHNLRYSCLYDTNQGEMQSNEITVKLHGRCVVQPGMCLHTYMCACALCMSIIYMCAHVSLCIHVHTLCMDSYSFI